jgi:hypothetical protein
MGQGFYIKGEKMQLKSTVVKIFAFGLVFTLLTLSACSKNADPDGAVASDNTSSMSLGQIEAYFEEVKQICDADNGDLWGRNLYSPMLIIDPETLETVANDSDNEGILIQKGNLYVGRFSEDAIVANSTAHWGDKDWSMMVWPLGDETERRQTMCHEMFHYQQPLLYTNDGADATYDNSHMDKLDARISIRMEWNALFAALDASGTQREEAIADVLAIRTDRRNTFSSAEDENKFEIAEGMAEYTSYKLCYSTDEAQRDAAGRLYEKVLEAPTFVRSFGYVSGTLYGLLLDAVGADWRLEITYNTDLGELLKNVSHVGWSGGLTQQIKDRYNYAQIYEQEMAIQAEKDEIIAGYIDKFIRGPLLTLKLENISMGFNPTTLQPLPGLGMVYPNIELKSDCGSLSVIDGGCLLSDDFKQAVVSAEGIEIEGDTITGIGWTFVLNEGYVIQTDGENHTVMKADNAS